MKLKSADRKTSVIQALRYEDRRHPVLSRTFRNRYTRTFQRPDKASERRHIDAFQCDAESYRGRTSLRMTGAKHFSRTSEPAVPPRWRLTILSRCVRVTRAQWVRGTKNGKINYQNAKVTADAFIDQNGGYPRGVEVRSFSSLLLHPFFHGARKRVSPMTASSNRYRIKH